MYIYSHGLLIEYGVCIRWYSIEKGRDQVWLLQIYPQNVSCVIYIYMYVSQPIPQLEEYTCIYTYIHTHIHSVIMCGVYVYISVCLLFILLFVCVYYWMDYFGWFSHIYNIKLKQEYWYISQSRSTVSWTVENGYRKTERTMVKFIMVYILYYII